MQKPWPCRITVPSSFIRHNAPIIIQDSYSTLYTPWRQNVQESTLHMQANALVKYGSKPYMCTQLACIVMYPISWKQCTRKSPLAGLLSTNMFFYIRKHICWGKACAWSHVNNVRAPIRLLIVSCTVMVPVHYPIEELFAHAIISQMKNYVLYLILLKEL